MPQQLALELYHAIIHCLDDTTDLLSMALCCSAFRDEAQRFLFRHAELNSLHRRKQFISIINAAPLRLGPLIHTLHIRYERGLDKDNYTDGDDHVVSLSLALRAMHNLKLLRNEGVQIPSTVLQGCLFNLHILVWTSVLDKPNVLFLLCEFLPIQHVIKHLRLSHTAPFDVAEVPTNLCPRLSSLGAMDNSTLTALLRDNKIISRFQWHGSGGLPQMSIRQLNLLEYLLCGIRELDVGTSLQLTSLIFLELRIDRATTLILSFLIQFLRHMPRLEVLVFHIVGTIHGFTWHNTSDYRQAFELCPTLRYIDAGQEENPFYHRFLRSGDDDNGLLVTNKLVHDPEQGILEWRREYVGL